MKGMLESTLMQRINAQCNPLLLYLHRLTGIRYVATYESACSYELNPLHGQPMHVSVRDLADAEVWQRMR
jgi:hypothetical protein